MEASIRSICADRLDKCSIEISYGFQLQLGILQLSGYPMKTNKPKHQHHHGFILLYLALMMIFLSGCQSKTKQEAASDRPNFLVFLCDDLGYGDLSSYGHPNIQTPNLDRMAAAGIRLTACYSAAPVCSPSRVGLLTGRNPNKAGVYDWIPHAGAEQKDDLRDLVHMRENETTLPGLLKSSNYQTCLVGKWHCNGKFNSSEQPQPHHFGFDHWLATQNNAYPSHENPTNFVRNGTEIGPMEGYSCQLIVDEAIRWLDSQEENDPFYLQITFHEPHEPVASPPSLVKKYLEITGDEDQAQYFANVENVDLAVGKMMQALKERGLDKNTLVVFTSDNGPETLNRYRRANRSFGSPGQLKGMKLWTHEAGFRVPGIIHWPDKIRSGRTVDLPVSSLDLLPTFCHLAGVQMPEKEWDGANITPLLEGDAFEREKPLLWCFYHALNEHRLAMRHEGWKIMAKLTVNNEDLYKYQNLHTGNIDEVRSAQLTDFLLFKIDDDIAEEQEVATKYPDELERMKALLLENYHDLLEGSHIWQRDSLQGKPL